MQSDVRLNRIGMEFGRRADRQSPLGTVEPLTLRRLLIEGKAAAQAHRGNAAFERKGRDRARPCRRADQ
jgi:hypothetical protein